MLRTLVKTLLVRRFWDKHVPCLTAGRQVLTGVTSGSKRSKDQNSRSLLIWAKSLKKTNNLCFSHKQLQRVTCIRRVHLLVLFCFFAKFDMLSSTLYPSCMSKVFDDTWRSLLLLITSSNDVNVSNCLNYCWEIMFAKWHSAHNW